MTSSAGNSSFLLPPLGNTKHVMHCEALLLQIHPMGTCPALSSMLQVTHMRNLCLRTIPVQHQTQQRRETARNHVTWEGRRSPIEDRRVCVGRTCRADIPRVMLVAEPNPSRRAASVSVDSSSRPDPKDTSLPLVARQCPLLPASPANRLRRCGGCACVAAPDSDSAPDRGSIPAPSPWIDVAVFVSSCLSPLPSHRQQILQVPRQLPSSCSTSRACPALDKTLSSTAFLIQRGGRKSKACVRACVTLKLKRECSGGGGGIKT